jgi:ribosomal protein S18 acetylase RimI-like enzyme
MQIEQLTQLTDDVLDQIMAIWLTGNLDAHPFVSADYWQEAQPEVATQIREATIYVVRDDDETIVGFAGMVDRYLAGLFVKQGYRDQGVGSMLLFALKSDYKLIKLNVYEKNEQAVKFYHKHGFEVKNRQIDDETDQVDLMMKYNA